MDYALIVENTKHLVIANISFFSSNIDATIGIDSVTLESLQFKFPSSSHRMLKSHVAPFHTHINGNDISVINCTFLGAEGPALQYGGRKSNNYIHNNEFSYSDWTGQGDVGTIMDKSNDGEFSQNTLRFNGNAHGLRYTGRNGIMKFNYATGQCWGLIQNDGASMQISPGAQNGVIITHNWVHNSPKKGLRFDGNGHPPSKGYHGYQGFNVVWNIHGNKEMYPKGDNHTVESNLAYDDNDNTDW